MTVVETNIHAFWGAKQTAKTTAATAPSSATTGKRLILAAQGDLSPAPEMGSEAFNDLDFFGDAQDYIATVSGAGGTLPILATPNELAWVCWCFLGVETVNPIVGPPVKKEHVITPNNVINYFSFWKRVGSGIIVRERITDCVPNTLEITAGTGQQVMRATLGLMALDPGEKVAADPTLAMPTSKQGFLWTEADGAVKISGAGEASAALTGPTQYTITLNKNLELLYADSVVAHDVQPGTPTIGVTLSMVLDQAGFDVANRLLYATTTPAPGSKPAKFLGGLGSFDVLHTQLDNAGVATGNKAQFVIPGVRWEKPSAVAVPNPGGGGGTLELTGQMRKVGAAAAITATVTADDVTFTV